jgi:hypothetical protein
VLLLVGLHESEVGKTVSSSLDVHGLALLNAHAFVKRELFSHLGAVIEVETFFFDLDNDRLNVGSNVSLGVVSLSIHLVEHQVLSPLELLLSPGQVLLEHLGEDKRIKNDVKQDDWTPPNSLLFFESHVSEDQQKVNDHTQAKGDLSVVFELEL